MNHPILQVPGEGGVAGGGPRPPEGHERARQRRQGARLRPGLDRREKQGGQQGADLEAGG